MSIWLIIVLIVLALLIIVGFNSDEPTSVSGPITITVILVLSWAIVKDLPFLEKDIEQYYEYSLVSEEEEVVSCSMDDGLYGDFIIGCGTIENKTKYRFYVYDSLGYYVLKDFDSNVTKIVETDSIAPKVVISYYTKARLYNNIAIRFFLKKDEYEDVDVYKLKENILYVPKGTIIKNFKL